MSIVGCDSRGYVKPEDIGDEIRENTKAIVVNHCSNVTGSVCAFREISQIANAEKVLLIFDASQSIGLVPIDVTNLHIDIVVFTGHKALYGLPGIGGLWMREGLELHPLKVGGTGVKSESLYQPEERPLRYEAGTPNVPGIVSLNAGLDFIMMTGTETITKRAGYLYSMMTNTLQDISGVELYGASKGTMHAPVCSFNIRGIKPAEVGYMLEHSFGIVVRTGLHCAPLIHQALGSYPDGSVRVSASYFTRDQDIEYLGCAIKQICRVKGIS